MLALLYILVGALTTSHSHGPNATWYGGSNAAADITLAETGGHDGPHDYLCLVASHATPAADCVVCALAANLGGLPPVPAPAMTDVLASAPIPAPPLRSVPFHPFRFCDPVGRPRATSRVPAFLSRSSSHLFPQCQAA